MSFKAGDIIEMQQNCRSCKKGKKYKVAPDTNGCLCARYDIETGKDHDTDACHCNSGEFYWKLSCDNSNINKNFMTDLISKAKKLALKVSNPEEAKLREAGIHNDCGDLTEEGKVLLLSVIADEPAIKQKLVTLAEELISESKEAK